MNSIIRTFILLAASVAIFLPLSCSSKAQAEIPESYVTMASEEAFLLNIETTDNSETTAGWAFWKDGEGVRAMYSENYADTNGRVRANQYYYKGVAKDGYLLLTEEVQ